MKKRSGSREGGCRKILESCFTGHRGSRERLSGKIKKKSFISAFWVDKRWILVISLNVLQSWLPVLLSSFSSSYTFFLLAPLQSTTSFPYLSSSVYILLFSLFVIFFFFLSFKYFCSFSFFGSIFGIFRGSDQMFKARCPRKMLNVMKENWFNTDNNK